MNSNIQALVEEIHASATMAGLVVTGAGSRALTWVLGVGGASRTVVEATVPYSSRALRLYLGWEPVKYVSAPVAVALAAAAFRRAHALRDKPVRVLGVSCTATIATDRPKKGEHQCYVAVWNGESVTTFHCEFEKGARDRRGEEEVVSSLYLNALAEGCGLTTRLPVALTSKETIAVERSAVVRPLERLLDGSVDSLMVYGPAAMVANSPFRAAILSGSFNPLHEGHLELARVAQRYSGLPVVFEMSVRNVDKPALTKDEVEARLAQFDELTGRVVLDREPLFLGKARLFPNSVFVLGHDTAVRLVDPKYYQGGMEGLRAALSEIRNAGCRFLVAGRLTNEGFRTLEDIAIPEGFADLFKGIPEADFRIDVSSTELRQLTDSNRDAAP